MRKTLLLLLLTCVVIPLQAKTPKDFVPKGWKIIKEAKGDLNRDSRPDHVLIIEKIPSKKENFDLGPPRVLLVLFQKSDKTFRQAVRSEKSTMLSGEGGVFGDPLSSLSIKKKSLFIEYYAGSNWRWSYRLQFRHKRGKFRLIGAYNLNYFNVTRCIRDEKDYNLLTGRMIRKTKTEKRCRTRTRKYRKRNRKPYYLKTFDRNMLESLFKV